MKLSARCLALLLACAAPAAAQDWSYGAAAEFDSGKYGGTGRVDSLSVPLTLERHFRDADLGATFSWLRQSATGRVVRVGGKPAVVSGARTSSGGAEAGPGDVLVRGLYRIKRESPGSFDFALGGRLKLPTANEEKGLGTGEMDQGAGFEFGKELNPRWRLLARGYYTIIGDPEGADFNNQLELAVGFYRPLEEGLGLTVLYETTSALADGNADPRALTAVLGRPGRGGLTYTFGLTLGLSEGSQQYGLSAGLGGKF